MHLSALSVAVSLGLHWTLAAGVSIPRDFERHSFTRRDLTSAQVRRELGEQVSETTLIFGPDDTRFNDSISRWTEFSKPDVQVVIEVGQESDVATIVKYCNANSIDFLAVGGGHGMAGNMRRFSGIQISMPSLDSITIDSNGKTAWFGGGTLVGPVIDFLWNQGYVTTTGGCECVGMMGAGLGGGHGRYEGLYGMISDNIRQLNVILADGSAIRVNDTNYPDLLWGLKGAGHNFGIVTSYEMNVYPRGPETWHYHNYIWTGQYLERVFETLNRFHGNGTTPVNMAFNVGNFLMNSTISTTDPVLSWTFSYRGDAHEAERLLAPFNAIPAAYEESGDVAYTEIAARQGTSMDDPICQHGLMHSTSTAGLLVYNVTAERRIYETFQRVARADPELAANTAILHEGYSTEGVEAIDSDSSAYPFRQDHHLMFFNAAVEPGQDARQKAAWDWAAEVRDLWNAGQPDRPVHAYVNYAAGFESLPERYGHEAWRLEKLRGLKARYDPHNRFRFFNPIVVN